MSPRLRSLGSLNMVISSAVALPVKRRGSRKRSGQRCHAIRAMEPMGAGNLAKKRPKRAGLALGVAHPGANHAAASAELVAVLGRRVLRAAKRLGGGPAARPAGVGAIDGESRAATAHGRDH